MNETTININMHSMTHQEVKADRIGFSIKMMPEMIDLIVENIEDMENYLAWLRDRRPQISDWKGYRNRIGH